MTRRSLLLRDFPEALSSRSKNKMSDTAGRLERGEATDGERIRHQGRSPRRGEESCNLQLALAALALAQF